MKALKKTSYLVVLKHAYHLSFLGFLGVCARFRFLLQDDAVTFYILPPEEGRRKARKFMLVKKLQNSACLCNEPKICRQRAVELFLQRALVPYI